MTTPDHDPAASPEPTLPELRDRIDTVRADMALAG